jgi:chromosome segregation ATPase
MSDDPKRRPSNPSRRVRHDNRAEPNSTALPEPEAVVTRRRRDSTPAARPKPVEARPGRPPNPAEKVTAREIRAPRVSDLAEETPAVRLKLEALRVELAQKQHRLDKLLEERDEEADRFSELLAQLSAFGTRQKEAETEIARLTDELTEERATSAWLRTAGEQATREAAEVRAKARHDSVAVKARAEATSEASAALAKREEETQLLEKEKLRLEEELGLARSRERTLTEEATNLRADLEDARRLGEALERARADLRDAEAAKARLEGDLEALRIDADARVKKLEEELLAAHGDADAREKAALDDLAAAKRDADVGMMKLEEELAAAAVRSERVKEELRAAHTAETTRLTNDYRERTTAAAKDAEGRIRTLSSELQAATTARDAAQKQRDSLAAEAKRAEAKAHASQRELAAATALVSEIVRSLEALANAEEGITKLRGEADASRSVIADRAVALRLALSRATDADVGSK